MTDAEIQPRDEPLLASERLGAGPASRDTRFVRAIASAMLLHAMLLIGVGASKPRQIGDPSGAENAISVDLVTEAELKSMTDRAEKSGQPVASPANPKPPVEQKPEQQTEPVTDPVTEILPAVPPTETKTPASDSPSSADVPDVVALPLPGPESSRKTLPEKSAVQPKQKPQDKRTAKLDLSPPPPAAQDPVFAGTGSAGFERPPGITRSGANDAFARGVIRALKATMPQLRNTFGRVTVRIVLNQTGNLADVKVMKPSNVGGLDQNVVFATQQTNYPFPPPNSLDVDRIFVVTYIYK